MAAVEARVEDAGRRGIRWRTEGVLALVDQVLFGSATLAVGILLARGVAPREYGAFNVAFFVLTLVGALHTVLLTEPILVLAPTRYRNCFGGYLAIVSRAHWLGTGAAAVAIALGGAVLRVHGSDSVGNAVLGAAVAVPCVLFLWLLRRACYARLAPGIAAVGDTVYLVTVLALLGLLASAGSLTPAASFGALSVAACLASATILAGLARAGSPTEEARPAVRDVLSHHWDYGRWNALAEAFYWGGTQVLLVLIPLALGLRAAAASGAVLVLFRPLHPILQSATALLLPAGASAAVASDIAALRRQLARFAVAAATTVVVYGGVLTVFAEPLMRTLYRGKYGGHTLLVALFALGYVAATVVQVVTIGLKSVGQVRAVPAIWIVPAAITLAGAYPAMRAFGLAAGVLVSVAAYAVAALLGWRRFARALAETGT